MTKKEKKTETPFIRQKDACVGDGIFKAILQADQARDWRWLPNGWPIPTQSYADQPYVVQADDGGLVCVLTTGEGPEGSPGQHVTSMRSEDGGRIWSDPTPVESPENPESSYAVLLKVPSGRIYCFYNYNADNIREIQTDLPGNPVTYRVDTLGYHVFKYSDDHGRTWSEKYHVVPIRESAIDRNNVTGGRIRFMWNVGRPFVRDGAAYISIHKVGNFGEGFMSSSEGWLVRSDNILHEPDPEKIEWETLPDGDRGLTTPAGGGPVSDEQSYSVLSDGSLYAVYRSIDGYLTESYSRDAGHTWSPPRYKCFSDGRRMKHPRAAGFTWRCSNGRYLQWFHNHGGPFLGAHERDELVKSPYEDRNPVWVSVGSEAPGPEGVVLEWSEPEILFYEDDVVIRISYPDLLEVDGRMLITETQKHCARIHEIDPVFLKKLWGQFDGTLKVNDEPILEVGPGPDVAPMPMLPVFSQRDFRRKDHGLVDLRQGFTLMLELSDVIDPLSGPVLDNRTPSGTGWALEATAEHGLVFTMSDGQTRSVHVSPPGLWTGDGRNTVAVVVDGGPKIVSYIVNGRFADGGDCRQFGWSRFSPMLISARGSVSLRVGSMVRKCIIYARALLTCEVVLLQNGAAGKTATALD